MKPRHVRKALVALVTGLSEAVTLGLFEGTAEKVVLCVIAAAGVYGVYRVPNVPSAPQVGAE